MGLSFRNFLRTDTLYRLPAVIFERMIRDPNRHPLPAFTARMTRARFGIRVFYGCATERDVFL
jgi:hypothetical protein